MLNDFTERRCAKLYQHHRGVQAALQGTMHPQGNTTRKTLILKFTFCNYEKLNTAASMLATENTRAAASMLARFQNYIFQQIHEGKGACSINANGIAMLTPCNAVLPIQREALH